MAARRLSFSLNDNAAALMSWCQQQALQVGVKIPDGGWNNEGWKNGKFFCAILANYFPEKINFTSLEFNAENAKKNLSLAFKVREEAGIYACIDGVDDVEFWDKKVYVPELQFWHEKLSTLTPSRSYSAPSLPVPGPGSLPGPPPPPRPSTPTASDTSPLSEKNQTRRSSDISLRPKTPPPLPRRPSQELPRSPSSGASPVTSDTTVKSTTPAKQPIVTTSAPSSTAPSKPSPAPSPRNSAGKDPVVCSTFEPVHPTYFKSVCKNCKQGIDLHSSSQQALPVAINETPSKSLDDPKVATKTESPARQETREKQQTPPDAQKPLQETESKKTPPRTPSSSSFQETKETDTSSSDADIKKQEKVNQLLEQVRREQEEKRIKREQELKEAQERKTTEIKEEKEKEKDDEAPDIFGRKNLKSTATTKPLLDRGIAVSDKDIDRPVDTSSIGSVKQKKEAWDVKAKENEKNADGSKKQGSLGSTEGTPGATDYRKRTSGRDCCGCIIS